MKLLEIVTMVDIKEHGGMVYAFFDKKIGSGISLIEQPSEESHKPVIKIFKRRTVYERFKDNILATDLALSSKNKSVKYLCVIDVFTNYAWVKPLKDKKR